MNTGDMNTETDQEPRPGSSLRTFGVRAAALAGLVVAVGAPVAGAVGAFDAEPAIVVAQPDPPNPSTCCGKGT
jgi:hypothetical protein